MEIFSITVLTLAFLVYIYYKKSFQYWERRGIPTIAPSIPFGHFGNPLVGKDGFVSKVTDMYKQFKAQGAKFGGLYIGTKPMLLVVHPESIRKVLTKDFQHFNSHGIPFNEKDEPLQAHLFNLAGKRWKDLRVRLTPTFTSGKMKMMFQTLLDCSMQLEEYMQDCHQQKNPLDIKEVLACFTTDVIGSCAFGLECNSFKNPDAEFRKYGRRVFQRNTIFQIRRFLATISPYLTSFLKINFTDEETSKFFLGAVKEMINYRHSNKITRNDFMQILIDMEAQAKLEGKEALTLEQIAAQVFVFFLAGFETSSTTMTFCLYELAHDQEIQDKLREEINRTMKKHKGELTYDGIMEMKYLDQVIDETLRKYPPVHLLPRKCTQTYEPYDGAIIEEGTRVIINMLGLQRDEEYFPNPEKFDPDRFSEENKHKIVPYTYISFGEGPRICLGLRFGVMQTKVGISLVLKKYRLLPHKSLKYPLDLDTRGPVLSAKGTILLTTEKV